MYNHQEGFTEDIIVCLNRGQSFKGDSHYVKETRQTLCYFVSVVSSCDQVWRKLGWMDFLLYQHVSAMFLIPHIKTKNFTVIASIHLTVLSNILRRPAIYEHMQKR